jgi:hypothetical protein
MTASKRMSFWKKLHFGFQSCLLFRSRQIGTSSMRNLCRRADGIKQRGMWLDGFADVHRVCAHGNVKKSIFKLHALGHAGVIADIDASN